MEAIYDLTKENGISDAILDISIELRKRENKHVRVIIRTCL